jgi:hypothetical protein
MGEPPSSFQHFSVTLSEVAKLQLREAFLTSQPILTLAVRSIYVSRFGEGAWIDAIKSKLGPRMHDFVIDDGRPFDM